MKTACLVFTKNQIENQYQITTSDIIDIMK